jgi:hypothetical protein
VGKIMYTAEYRHWNLPRMAHVIKNSIVLVSVVGVAIVQSKFQLGRPSMYMRFTVQIILSFLSISLVNPMIITTVVDLLLIAINFTLFSFPFASYFIPFPSFHTTLYNRRRMEVRKSPNKVVVSPNSKH